MNEWTPPKRIQDFMTQNKIKFITNYNDVSSYDNLTNTVNLGMSSHKDVYIPTLLHELGHFIDRNKYISYVEKITGKKLTRIAHVDQKDMPQVSRQIVRFEIKAWRNAINLAKKFNIKLTEVFYWRMRECLRSYFKTRIPMKESVS